VNGAQTKEVEAILRPLPVDDAVKTATWKAYFSAQTPEGFFQSFDPLPIPREVKATLWDLKFGPETPATPAPPAKSMAVRPAVPGTTRPRTGLTLPPLPNLQAPMVDVAGIVPETRAGAPGGERFTMGVARGAARGAGALTSPENVGLMGAMHLAPSLLGRAGAMVAGGAGLYFTFEMAKALVESFPEAFQAYKDRDWGKLGEIIGEDAVTALLLGHGGQETRQRAAELRPGALRTKPVEAVPESKAAQARARAAKPPGPAPPPMSRQQRRALSEVPGTARAPEEGAPSPESAETANLRRIASRLGMDYDTMMPADRAALAEIQHEMNLANLQNIATPAPAWWPTTARERPPGGLPPVPTAIEPVRRTEAAPEVPAAGVPAPQMKPGVPEMPQGIPPAVEPPPGRLGREPATPPQAPRDVRMMPVSEIAVDAPRFQFKTRGIGEKGVSGELREVQNWNEELAGVVSLWRDPATGKNYVVNGHHRLELAQRLKVPEVLVRFIQAKDATEARGKGALINIAEGRGSAIDAAKVFRDLHMGPDQLGKRGVSLKGPVSKDALALAGLPADIFDQVWSEAITAQRGVILGEMLAGRPADQRAVLEVVARAENRGKRPTDDQIREMIRLQVGAGAGRTEVQETLFGPEEIQRGALLERARISEYVRRELVQDKRLFGTVSEAKGARKLGEAGNIIRAEDNARIALQTAQAIELYDKLSTRAGPVNDVLTRAADELAAGGEPDAVKRRAYTAIREAIAREVPGAAGARPGGPSPDRVGAGDLGRGGEAGPEVPLRVPPAAGPTRELSRIVPVSGPTFDPELNFRQQVLEARVIPGEVEGYPVLFVNSQAMAVLSWVGYESYSSGVQGKTMPHTGALERIKGLESVADDYPRPSEEAYRIENVLIALRHNRVATEGRPMVLIDTSGKSPAADLKITAAEEVAHAAQIEATGARFDKHVGYAFYDHPHAQVAARTLREAGYRTKDDAALSLEIGVRLMDPGRYQELGLRWEEAKELAMFYCQTLEDRHGPQAVARVTNQVYNAFKEAPPYDAREATREGRHSAGEGQLAPVPTAPEGRGERRGGSGLDQIKPPTEGQGGGRKAETPSASLFGEATEQRIAAENAAYARKLEADRLTAQFRAPITREEQLRRLKRAKAKEQPGLFGPEPAAEAQGSLFRLLRLPPVPGSSILLRR